MSVCVLHVYNGAMHHHNLCPAVLWGAFGQFLDDESYKRVAWPCQLGRLVGTAIATLLPYLELATGPDSGLGLLAFDINKAYDQVS